MENGSTKFVPNFEQIYQTLCDVIVTMIRSVERLPRVEYQLFQDVDDIEIKHLTTIELDPSKVKEKILDVTRDRLRKVVQANSHGPKQ